MFRIYVQLSHFSTNICTTNSILSIITVRIFWLVTEAVLVQSVERLTEERDIARVRLPGADHHSGS